MPIVDGRAYVVEISQVFYFSENKRYEMNVMNGSLAIGEEDRLVLDIRPENALALVVLSAFVEQAEDLREVAIPSEMLTILVRRDEIVKFVRVLHGVVRRHFLTFRCFVSTLRYHVRKWLVCGELTLAPETAL